MSKIGKKAKAARDKLEKDKLYDLTEACDLVKSTNCTKFDASVDVDIHLNVDPRKADQMVRGVVSLPNGTGKTTVVLALCGSDKEEEAKAAGAEYVGLEDYIEKIKTGWTDVDVIITTPNQMSKIGQLGRILGPRGLMPNPKSGTVTQDLGKAIQEIKQGKIDFKVDKFGIIHTRVGKVSFETEQLKDNVLELLNVIIRLKPSAAKGNYLKNITLTSTMGPGIPIDKTSLKNTNQAV